jgi:hypothetical protein
MGNLTLRSVKGSPLSFSEMDSNFEHFTGSFTNTGIITAVGFSGSFTGSFSSHTASHIEPLDQDLIITGSVMIDQGTFVNHITQSSAVTIPVGHNAMLAGPIYNSSSITVPVGSTLTIL